LDQSQQTVELSSYIGKILRDNFGRGPEGVFVAIEHKFISIYIRNFLSPTEKILFQQKQEEMVQQTRDTLMKTLIPEIKAFIKIVTGMDIGEFYYDWGLHNKSGLFLGICSDVSHSEEPIDYEGKDLIHHEIINLSKQSERAPTEINSYQLDSRTIVVIRNGILVSIEKQLIRQGYEEVLKIAKRTLEKGLLHNNNHFESILESRVIDIFVDWDFDLDKSVIVFITNPTK
jgi:uncharacterized protein YbcI